MTSKFLEYATNVAFRLSLSQPQLHTLYLLHSHTPNPKKSRWMDNPLCGYGLPHISTQRALEGKGLLYRKLYSLEEACQCGSADYVEALRSWHAEGKHPADFKFGPHEHPWPSHWSLTEAGEAVSEMLDKVGMFETYKTGVKAA